MLQYDLEVKYQTNPMRDLMVQDGQISGYASLFDVKDQNSDVVRRGAYAQSLAALAREGRQVKMLWQHDPNQPIGIWNHVTEDDKGLRVQGRILSELATGQEALALINAGAIDGLSIGYRTKRAKNRPDGRDLIELELWEVSLVTFPMLPEARVAPQEAQLVNELTSVIDAARRELRA